VEKKEATNARKATMWWSRDAEVQFGLVQRPFCQNQNQNHLGRPEPELEPELNHLSKKYMKQSIIYISTAQSLRAVAVASSNALTTLFL